MRAPPGPFRAESWRSPLRGPWLTSALGCLLLVSIPLIAVSGLLSYAAYSPRLAGNDVFGDAGVLGFFAFEWPTSPAWLYAATQGVHVTLGIVTVPILLAKLWSVIPKLFEWPPARSVAHALERATLTLLVGGALFEFATGLLNIQLFYPWKFSFIQAHYYGAWVFLGAFVFHVALKLPLLVRELGSGGTRARLRAAATTEPRVTIPAPPAEPTLSRRGFLGLVGASSLGLAIVTAGQSIGGPLRKLAVLAPHGRDPGRGPNGFQINKTAEAVGIGPREVTGWALELSGPRQLRLTRDQLLAMPQHTYDLPIACVEGWSTTQRWSGVRLRDLATLAGSGTHEQVHVRSLQRRGSFSKATLSGHAVADERALLALRVNGADLSLDHGFPARIIVPALPGVHCTKWVASMTFRRSA